MKHFDIYLQVPQLKDGDEAREMAAFVAKLQEILQQMTDSIGTIPVVASAPVLSELQETADGKGQILSEVKILDDATQSNRKLYYRFKDTLRLIDSA